MDIVCFGKGYYAMALTGLFGNLILQPLEKKIDIGNGAGMPVALDENVQINSIYRKITKK